MAAFMASADGGHLAVVRTELICKNKNVLGRIREPALSEQGHCAQLPPTDAPMQALTSRERGRRPEYRRGEYRTGDSAAKKPHSEFNGMHKIIS